MQLLPAIFLWVAVSVIFFLTFSELQKESVYRLMMVLNGFFFLFEIYLVFSWLKSAELAPSDFIKSLGSPVLVVPNDISYFSIFLPLFYCSSQEILEKRYHQLLTIFNVLVFYFVSWILESRVSLLVVSVFLFMSVPWPHQVIRKPSKPALGSVFAFLLILLAFMYFFGKGTASMGTRLSLWLAGGYGFMESPWIGNGLATFGGYYDAIRGLEFDPYISMFPVDERSIPWPHNLVVELLFSFGLIIVPPIFFALRGMFLQFREEGAMGNPKMQVFLMLTFVALLEMTLLRLQTIPIIVLSVFALTSEHFSPENHKNQSQQMKLA